MINNNVKKIRNEFSRIGIIPTLRKIFYYLLNYFDNKKFKSLLSKKLSNEDRFTWIYENNHWNSHESFSGTGSTLKYTENIRKHLPYLFEKYSIKTVFDAPCGDFNWMKYLLLNVNISYIGGDIVKKLVEDLNISHGSEKISFVHFDLTRNIPPYADLMICRDCLFHLSYKDTYLVLQNFLLSGIPYLLTTTHINDNEFFLNKDIITGDFRLIDLFSNPYNFPDDPLESIDDWLEPDPKRQMNLWNRDQISKVMSGFKDF